MGIIQRLLGAYAFLLALAVAVHFVVTPVYDDGSTGYPVWAVFDWFMAPAVILAFAASLVWKFGLSNSGAETRDARRSFEVNTLFYSSLVLGLWFLSNWFGDLVGREVPLLWSFIDPLYVAVTGACGVRLWRSAGS